MSRYTVKHAGHQFAYRVRGIGPPVLFIQGVGLHGDGWAPQIDKLSDHYLCMSFDNRGTGESQWDGRSFTVEDLANDALAIMNSQGWGTAHIVGHSLGGLIALQMAMKDRRRVRSLSLLCTFPGGKWAAPMSLRMMLLGMRIRFGSQAMRRRAFLQLIMSPTGRATASTDRMAKELAPIFGHDLAHPPQVQHAQLRALRRCNPDLSELKDLAHTPTLVASAVHDPIATTKAGRALAKAIPNARYVEWGDASHGVPIEHAARVNSALKEHISAAETKQIP